MEAKIAKDRAELDELRFALNDVKDTIAGAKQMKEFNDNKADQKGEELDIMKADVFRNKEMVADMEQHGKEALEEIDKVNVDIDALKAQIETLYVGAEVLRRCCCHARRPLSQCDYQLTHPAFFFQVRQPAAGGRRRPRDRPPADRAAVPQDGRREDPPRRDGGRRQHQEPRRVVRSQPCPLP